MKIFCNSCKAHTNHELLEEYKQSFRPEDYPEMGIDFADGTWQILRCAGCETVSFREVWLTSEDYDPVTGDLAERETLYPRRSATAITPHSFFNVPLKLRKLYSEVVDCYNFGQYTLCAAGVRALIEGLCSDRGVRAGPVETPQGTKRRRNLEGKIEGLHEKGILTSKQARSLHGHRYIGNDALHELDTPARRELQIGIEILEHTLKSVYELPEMSEELQFRHSRRKIKRRSGNSS